MPDASPSRRSGGAAPVAEKSPTTPGKPGERAASAAGDAPDAAAPSQKALKPIELFAETAQPGRKSSGETDGGARPPREYPAVGETEASPELLARTPGRSPPPESESPIPGTRLDIPGPQIGVEATRVRRFLDSGGATLEGRLLDVDTGRGIAGAEIEAWMGTRTIDIESDAEGRFRLEGLVPGSRINLWITAAPTFVQERTEVSVPGDRPGFQGTFRMLSRAAVAGTLDGGAGMFLSRRGSRTLVTGLVAFGPGERAGVRVGDTIVAVGQRKVGDLGPGAIDYLLRGPIGSEVQLMVQTGSQPARRVVLVRSAR